MLKRIQNQKGMAIFETIPILVIFVILIKYSLGFFGAIHTGILQSIHARHYAFNTFAHRSNLVYFRATLTADNPTYPFFRFHGKKSEKAPPDDVWYASERSLTFLEPEGDEEQGRSDGLHTNVMSSSTGVASGDGVNPIWIQVQYGICINSKCGP